MDYNENLRGNLGTLIASSGKSMSSIARTGKMSEGTLRHFLSGHTQSMKVSSAVKIAGALGSSLPQLLLPPEEAHERNELDTLLKDMSVDEMGALTRLLRRPALETK